MSGPIVRKYGFPNFDKIFGPKPVLHGVDDEPKGEDEGDRGGRPSDTKTEPSKGPAAGEAGPDR